MKLQIFKIIFYVAIIRGICTITFGQHHLNYDASILVLNQTGDTLVNPYAGGMLACQYSVVELTGDTLKDLVIFDRKGSIYSVYTNQGGNSRETYQYEYEKQFELPKGSTWVLFNDYNCDGLNDLFMGGGGGIMLYQNNSVGAAINFTLIDVHIQYTYVATNPIFVNGQDIPAITDIDYDGDLDVLTFGLSGAYLNYYKNMSMETYGVCDSLVYELKNECWGHFSETGISTNALMLFDTCSINVASPETPHIGSTVLSFDANGDSVFDVLLGDVSFNNLVMGYNGGLASNTNSSIITQDSLFPSYSAPIDVAYFPGVFYEDVTNDGKKDLLASPNTTTLVDNIDNSVLYIDTSSTSQTNFIPHTTRFLQSEMIDVGEDAKPTFFDHNGDGLMDLVIGNYGYFDKEDVAYSSKLALYENIGTTTKAVFKEATDNYQGLSALNLGLALHPVFKDLDGDGDSDMLIGKADGTLAYCMNNPIGLIASFTLTSSQLKDNNNQIIDVGEFAAPLCHDMDNDGDQDLIIGKKNGRLTYYENIGSSINASFKFISDSLGNVNVCEPWDINGAVTGYSTPVIFTHNGQEKMLIGSQRGDVYLYDSIFSAVYHFIDTVLSNNGLQAVPSVLNQGSNFFVFSGNGRGGVSSFINDPLFSVKKEHEVNSLKAYPNPVNDIVTIEGITDRKVSAEVISVNGKSRFVPFNSNFEIDLSSFSKGMYILRLTTENGINYVRVLKR